MWRKMARGTIVNIHDVKNFTVDEAYSSRMVLDETNSESKHMQVNYGTLAPGANLLPPSAHAYYDEIYIIARGACRLVLDGQERFVKKGDVVFIPKGVAHGLDNTGNDEPVELLAILPKTPGPGESSVYDARVRMWGRSFVPEDR